jgi:collagenase-like PrtC family protease
MQIRAIKCKKCNAIIYSRTRHDYRSCLCKKNAISIDGGQSDYVRIIGEPNQIIDLTFPLNVTPYELYQDWNREKNHLGLIPPKQKMNISTFKVGDNLSNDLPAVLDRLNQKYSNKITEVFGSIAQHAWLAARPRFRLPNITEKQFCEHVKKLHSYGIEFNYTLNAPFLGSSSYIEMRLPMLKDTVGFLVNCGITRFTISSPLLAILLKNIYGNRLEYELSTIAALTQVSQLKSYHDMAGFTRFCMNIEKHRNFDFLKKAQEVANREGFVINLIVNEFCSSSHANYCSGCVLRQDCYNLHSVNETKEDYAKFGGYPMNYCMAGRGQEPYSWLRSRFILPQWLKFYRDIGITHYKITGRTGSTEYIKKIVEYYMKEKFDGNLLELWKPLESIYSGAKNSDADNTFIKTNLSCKKLIDNNFINHWLPNEDQGDFCFDCSSEDCGVSCNYCKEFYDKHLK